ncbi:dentin sialophosphoprotein-like, partial [Trifolium medium]|nr:dentin sialophosphoprotein-like [Trifolium medium]
QMDVDDNGVPASLSMFNESDKKSGHKDALVSKEKGNLVITPFVVNNVFSCFTIFTYWELVLDLYAGPKQNSFVLRKNLPKSSAGKRKNDNSAHGYTPPEQYVDINQQFGASSSGVTSLDSNQKHKQNTDYDSLGILTQIPLTHLDFSHAPNHTSISSNFSGPRAEHDGYMSPSLIESSYASNMDCSHGHSLVAAALKTNENREKYNSHDNLSSTSYKNERRANKMPFHSPSSSQQVAHQFENENEGHSKVRG